MRGLLIAVSFCVAALGCGRAERDTVAIGTAGPWQEGYARMVRRAVEMAAAEESARGGLAVQVVARDDGGDGVRAAAIAQEFLDDPRVVAVVGHANSGGMVGAAPLYDHGLVAVAPSATSPEITGISPWVFRVTTNDSVNGAMLARFAAQLGTRRAAVLYENNVYGRDLAQAFRAGYRGELVGVDPIAGDGSKVEPFVSYYARVAPDLIFVAGTEGSGRALLREARRQGFTPRWLSGDGWTGIASDPAAQGAYIAVPFSIHDPRPEAKRFVAAFRARYGEEPDANAAMAYDATRLLVKAVREVGADRGAVRDYLARVRGDDAYAGVTGDIRFAANGDPERARFVMTQVRGGALRPVGGDR
ncbi:MAG TPA: branched-chain amino acid ABC transporter substrate-binding protein [Longimicrobiaceae bacterium]|jgi:branched-chain amino acid transport system substrate-binding protein